jgi:hypothetical protein
MFFLCLHREPGTMPLAGEILSRPGLPLKTLSRAERVAVGWAKAWAASATPIHRLRYAVPLCGAVFTLVFAGVFLSNPQGEWHECYVRAAQRMQVGETIHRFERRAYSYPPAMAMFTMPLANLPPRVAIFAWYAVSMAATATALVMAWRLAGGGALVGLPNYWLAVLGLGLFLSFRFLIITLVHQQFDMLIAALVFAGIYLQSKNYELSGACLLGAAAAMKCTPLLFVPYLLWRGRPRAALLMSAVAVGLNFLPDALWPQTSGQSYAVDWAENFLGLVGRFGPGSWLSDFLKNQSIAGFFNRLLRAGLPIWPEHVTNDMSPLGEALSPWLVYGSGLLLLAGTCWHFGKPGRLDALPKNDARMSYEAGAIVCLMLLLSPMSSMTHYAVLLLPCLLIARMMMEGNSTEGHSARLRWLLAGLVLCGPLASKDLLGKSLGNWTLAWGVPTWFVLLALVGMWLGLKSLRSARTPELGRIAARA